MLYVIVASEDLNQKMCIYLWKIMLTTVAAVVCYYFYKLCFIFINGTGFSSRLRFLIESLILRRLFLALGETVIKSLV